VAEIRKAKANTRIIGGIVSAQYVFLHLQGILVLPDGGLIKCIHTSDVARPQPGGGPVIH